jgi:(Z)-2-((N-methylformamido)methylene)-5-hydroxybutyrolactone dehydrogenase
MSALTDYRLLIDGAEVEAADGRWLESLDPATGEAWARFPAAGEAEVDAAVTAAERAMTAGPWAAMTATQRGKLLRRLADLMAEQADRLAEVETRDTGKLIRETRAQIRYVADYLLYFAGAADKLEGATLPIDKSDMLVMTLREPIGVVAAVVPWNSQLMLAVLKLGPALAAGNAVVLKASEQAPAPLFELGRLCLEAGIPPGVVNVISGLGEPCGRALTSHPKVARIAFTGGPATARQVVRNSAENLALTTLELGGKSPIVVFDDADLDTASNAIVAGNFGASGQSCVAGTRVLLQSGIREQVLDRVAERARRIRIGDPQDAASEMGPLATRAQLDRVERAVAAAQAEGARLVTGGARPPGAGWYYQPTILDCPHRDITTVREELFGPVLSALSFESEDEAVALANDTPYGLASGVFTRDLGRALRVMKRIRSGIVWINTYRAVSPMAPFGGFGQSGLGREAGHESLLDYTRTKTVWINTSTQPLGDPFVMR